MARCCECPNCGADITDTYEPDDPSVGIYAGWFCDACDLAIGDDGQYERMEDDMPNMAATELKAGKPLGTPVSELSGQPGHPGFDEFCRIARSWGYE